MRPLNNAQIKTADSTSLCSEKYLYLQSILSLFIASMQSTLQVANTARHVTISNHSCQISPLNQQ